MEKTVSDVLQLIGRTPAVELRKVSAASGIDVPIVAKVEFFNPGGSVKDRIALAMIEDAEHSGRLKPGGVIVEPTSGNTGVGIAMVCAVRGYHLILTMPETMSVERRKLVAAYGAEVRLTPGSEGMAGAVKAADDILRTTEGAIMLQQFENKANPRCHYDTTGVEIWQQTGGKVDVFVAGVGTGGTVSGTGRKLKELNPEVRIVAVEPETSPLLTTGKAGQHKIQGIGANFVPKTYDASVVDEVLTVGNDEAFAMSRRLAREEGLLVGISAGAAVAAAICLAQRPEYKGKHIVALLPDTGERYLSVFQGE